MAGGRNSGISRRNFLIGAVSSPIAYKAGGILHELGIGFGVVGEQEGALGMEFNNNESVFHRYVSPLPTLSLNDMKCVIIGF